MANLRLGVVGAGYWGPNLIRNCNELGFLDSVCDLDSSALHTTRQAYPSTFTTTQFRELLQRPIEGVVIAAPAKLHAEMCEQAIGAGKHVLVEKPLALKVDEGQRVALAAERAGLIVLVGHLLLYHPAVKKLRALIADNAIGRVWHMRSRRLSLGKLRDHESVWWSFAPHDIALMLAVMGDEIQSVTASQTDSSKSGISDIAYADFLFSQERSAHIEVGWLDPEKSGRVDVFGSSGGITFKDSRVGATLSLNRFSVTQDEQGHRTVTRGESCDIAFGEEEPLRAELLAFAEAIRSGVEPETSAHKGVSVLKALFMADEAARSCAPLKVG